MRTAVVIAVVGVSLAVLCGAWDLAQREFWWAHPRAQAWLLVSLYWAALGLGLALCVWSARRLFGEQAQRAAALICAGLGGWLLLVTAAESSRTLLGTYWSIAQGESRPAEMRYNAESGRIEISGRLRAGSAARFKEVLQSAPQARVVEVSGPGGLVFEAKWISHQIEERGMDTLITGKCASACVDIFAAGRQRLMHAKAVVGLHSASSSLDDAAGVAQENQAFADRLYRLGVEPRFLMVGTETPADGIWINTARQAYLAGLATQVIESSPGVTLE